MPKGTQLTKEQEAQVAALRDAGHSIREIAEQLGKSKTCISNCINRHKNGQEIRRPGRPAVTTEQDRRRIIREVSNKAKSARRVKADLQLNCSVATIRNVIKSSGVIVYKKKLRKPILTNHQRQVRVDWCTRRKHWETRWRKIVFSDEKKFNLDGPDNNCYYYHDIRKPELLHNKRHSGGGSVMVWAAIGWFGKSEIAFLEGKQDSIKYQATLENYLLPSGARIGGPNWKFQQDNAPIHVSESTMQWLDDHNVEVISWPARSPDLNPVENVWAKLSQMVYANGRQFNSINELKVAITENWANVGLNFRRNLVSSMKNRVNEVIRVGGNTIKY